MKEEKVYLPWNITELKRLSLDYDKVGLPGCCGSWTLSMLSGVLVQLVIIIAQRVNPAIRLLHFNA